jgi:hypothetical protein
MLKDMGYIIDVKHINEFENDVKNHSKDRIGKNSL